ncbi:hypothetical protein NONI108955_31735 [Nocardia ninae]
MAGEGEASVAEGAGDGDDVGGHGALGVGGAVDVGGLVAVAVTAQVGADDGVVGGEVGGDVAPHEVGLREAVQQHDGAARAADRDIEFDLVGDGDPLVVESGNLRCHEVSFRCSLVTLDSLFPRTQQLISSD